MLSSILVTFVSTHNITLATPAIPCIWTRAQRTPCNSHHRVTRIPYLGSGLAFQCYCVPAETDFHGKKANAHLGAGLSLLLENPLDLIWILLWEAKSGQLEFSLTLSVWHVHTHTHTTLEPMPSSQS